MKTRILLLLPVLALTGCPEEPSDDVNDVEPIGSLSGQFTCWIPDDDVSTHDLGEAHFEGDLEHTGYIAGLRTQGCFAQMVESQHRGWVVQLRLLQQIDWDTAQVLELNLPIGISEGDDERLLEPGDEVVMSGGGGFGSLFWAVPGDDGFVADPLFGRTAGGIITVEEPAGLGPGDWFSGSFTDLRMGEL